MQVTPMISLLAAAVFYALGNSVMRYAAPEIGSLTVAFWTSLAAISGMGLRSFMSRGIMSPRGAVPFIAAQALAFFSLLTAFSMVPAAVAGAFFPLEGVIGILLGALLLREKMAALQVLGAGLGFVGGLVVSIDAFIGGHILHVPLAGILMAMVSSFVYGSLIPLARFANKENSVEALTFWYFVVVAVVSLPSAISSDFPGWHQILAILGLAVLEPLASMFYPSGLARGSTTQAATMLPLISLFTAIAAWTFLDEQPSLFTMIGGTIIALGAFLGLTLKPYKEPS